MTNRILRLNPVVKRIMLALDDVEQWVNAEIEKHGENEWIYCDAYHRLKKQIEKALWRD